MLAIARAFMVDLCAVAGRTFRGLAPLIVHKIVQVLRDVKSKGLPILLIEQNLHMALELADRHYILSKGEICYRGSSKELEADEVVKSRYLGVYDARERRFPDWRRILRETPALRGTRIAIQVGYNLCPTNSIRPAMHDPPRKEFTLVCRPARRSAARAAQRHRHFLEAGTRSWVTAGKAESMSSRAWSRTACRRYGGSRS